MDLLHNVHCVLLRRSYKFEGQVFKNTILNADLQYSTARRTDERAYRHVHIGWTPLPTVETFFVVWQRTKIPKNFQMFFILFLRVLLR